MLYTPIQASQTKMRIDESYEGETIEKKMRRVVNNKEPITDGAPLVYTERKNGVQAEYDIRTDRWEVATDAMGAVTKSHRAKREERQKTPEQKAIEKAAREGMKKEGETPANTADN